MLGHIIDGLVRYQVSACGSSRISNELIDRFNSSSFWYWP